MKSGPKETSRQNPMTYTTLISSMCSTILNPMEAKASNDGEAIGKAREWAGMFLKISNKKALLILTGGSISGSFHEVIDFDP
jgi:hypothetical protein